MRIDLEQLRAAEQRAPQTTIAAETAPFDARSFEMTSFDATPAKVFLPKTPSPKMIAARRAHLGTGGVTPSDREIERMLNGDDLVDEFYLHRALIAAHPVCRIAVRSAAGRELGFATGFMIAPGVLLTNWHVFKNASDAANSIAEFDYTLDIRGNPVASVRFALQPDQLFLSDKALDFAVVAVQPVSLDGTVPLTHYGHHRLNPDPNKVMLGEWVTIIQHPGGARRQYAIRDNQIEQKKPGEHFLWYRSDTAQGSSGSPAFNDQFQVVALHHLGRARRDSEGRFLLRDGTSVASLDGIDDAEVDWETNEGLRVSVLCAALRTALPASNPYGRAVLAAIDSDEGDIMSSSYQGRGPAMPNFEAANVPSSAPVAINNAGVVIPLQLHVTLGFGGVVTPPTPPPAPPKPAIPEGAGVEAEKLVQPIIDTDYSTRNGYRENHLGAGFEVPLPVVTDESTVSRMASNNYYVIPYEHFSIVMNKRRRLALYTASNVAGSKKARQPDPTKKYTRDDLGGLGKNDQEKWLRDRRISELEQLPDRFYNKDRKAFDKGHIVRRDDVCWGSTYKQVQRANGDTFHTTNCSPQVGAFNQSKLGGIWGELENEILNQAVGDSDRYSLFAGPVFSEDDEVFHGVDDFGDVEIQIPSRFWKIAIDRDGEQLRAFAFLLEQDLSAVVFEEELAFSDDWKPFMVTISELEEILGNTLRFPKAVHDADQSAASAGEELMRTTSLTRR